MNEFDLYRKEVCRRYPQLQRIRELLARNIPESEPQKLPNKIVIPQKMRPFTDARHPSSEVILHCYVDDTKIKRLVNHPEKYVDKFAQFAGIIGADFSVYRDDPLELRLISTKINRAIESFYRQHGIYVVPNVRWGTPDDYCFTVDAIGQQKIVAISTHGCIKGAENRYYFKLGLSRMIESVAPEHVLVHGPMPHDVFGKFERKTVFHPYYSAITKAHR